MEQSHPGMLAGQARQEKQSAPRQASRAWSPQGLSLGQGEAPSNESLTPGAVSRLLENVSFLYVNKSFLESALISAGCC